MTVPLRVGGMLGVRAKLGPRALRVDPGVANRLPRSPSTTDARSRTTSSRAYRSNYATLAVICPVQMSGIVRRRQIIHIR